MLQQASMEQRLIENATEFLFFEQYWMVDPY